MNVYRNIDARSRIIIALGKQYVLYICLCVCVSALACGHVAVLNQHETRKAFPLQTWTGPWGFQEVEAPEFLDNRHMKVVRLSALRTGPLYPQE
jgi:hypothetical protein